MDMCASLLRVEPELSVGKSVNGTAHRVTNAQAAVAQQEHQTPESAGVVLSVRLAGIDPLCHGPQNANQVIVGERKRWPQFNFRIANLRSRIVGEPAIFTREPTKAAQTLKLF
jgi:hypothetical protein